MFAAHCGRHQAVQSADAEPADSTAAQSRAAAGLSQGHRLSSAHARLLGTRAPNQVPPGECSVRHKFVLARSLLN